MATDFQYSRRYSQVGGLVKPLALVDYVTISRKLTSGTYKTYLASLQQLYDYSIREIRYNGIFQQLSTGSGLKVDSSNVVTLDTTWMDTQYINANTWPFNQVGSPTATTLPFTISGTTLTQTADIPIHNEGVVYSVKAQAYSLASYITNNTGDVFAYVVIFNGLAKIKFSNTILAEHISQIYIGKISFVSGSTTTVTLTPVTRWEVARPSVVAIGSAIPASSGSASTVVNTVWDNTTLQSGTESEYRFGVDDIIDTDRRDTNYLNYVSIYGPDRVLVGKTINLAIKTNMTITNQTWGADASTSATTNQSGIITGVTPGVTMVNCRINNLISSWKSILVYGPTITITVPNSSVNTGTTQQASFTITPNEYTANSFTWTSSDTSIATVSSSGLITGVAVGSATITCTVDGVYRGVVAIQVTQTPTITIPIAASLNGQTDLMKTITTALNRTPLTTDIINIYIPSTITLTASSIEQYALRCVGFPQDIRINIINAGRIFGAGASGSSSGASTLAGGVAIYSDGTAKLTITNSGSICGGGGAGAAYGTVVCGGGGAPLGASGAGTAVHLVPPEGASVTISGFGGVSQNTDGSLNFGGRGGFPGMNGGNAFTTASGGSIVSGGLAGQAIVGSNVTVTNINGGRVLGS